MFKKLLVLLGVTTVAAGVGAVCYSKRASDAGRTFEEQLKLDRAKLKERAEEEKAYFQALLEDFEGQLEEVVSAVEEGVEAGLQYKAPYKVEAPKED